MSLLLRTAESELEGDRAPEAQLRALLRAFMAIYVRAKAKHAVLLAELGSLPAGAAAARSAASSAAWSTSWPA